MATASTPRRSGSPCQSSSASPKRSHAIRASTSSQLPGKRMTPNLILRWPLPRYAPRSPRSAGWPAGARTSRGPETCPPRRAPRAARRERWSRPRSRGREGRAPRPAPAGRGSPPWAGSAHGRASRRAAPLEPALEGLARDPLIGLDVARPGAVDDLRRQRRRRRRLVPAGLGCPVAHVLLVEARLGTARLVAGGGPEARGVWGQGLVAEDDRAVRAAAEL